MNIIKDQTEKDTADVLALFFTEGELAKHAKLHDFFRENILPLLIKTFRTHGFDFTIYGQDDCLAVSMSSALVSVCGKPVYKDVLLNYRGQTMGSLRFIPEANLAPADVSVCLPMETDAVVLEKIRDLLQTAELPDSLVSLKP